MALGEFDRHFTRLVLPREMIIGITSGIAFGLLVGVIGWVWHGQSVARSRDRHGAARHYGRRRTVRIADPHRPQTLGRRPGVAASIFVTTATDMLGFLFFLGLAALLIDRIA